MVTKVGDGCLFMMGAHVGHDCVVGNNVIIANYGSIAGHVEVGDNVIIGGLAGVHQWVRIGAGAMIGGMAAVWSDVIPRGTVVGERAHLEGLNIIGMRRAGVPKDDINALRAAYKIMFNSGENIKDALPEVVAKYGDNPLVAEVIDFIQTDSSRALHTPKH